MTEPGNTIRTFIALETPALVRGLLAQTIGQLREAIPNGVRWVDPSGIHLTLKFLGEVDPRRVDDLLQAMAASAKGSPSFEVCLAGLGVFPNQRQPRVLWAGLGGDLGPLEELQQKVDEAVCQLGFRRENRPFHPHLTLGRVRDGVPAQVVDQIGAALAAPTPAPSNPWRAEAVVLIRSFLTARGALYSSLGAVALEGPAGCKS